MVCCMQIGNLKGESGGAVATQQHLQRRRKNLIKVLDNVKVPNLLPALPAHLLPCPQPTQRPGLPCAAHHACLAALDCLRRAHAATCGISSLLR